MLSDTWKYEVFLPLPSKRLYQTSFYLNWIFCRLPPLFKVVEGFNMSCLLIGQGLHGSWSVDKNKVCNENSHFLVLVQRSRENSRGPFRTEQCFCHNLQQITSNYWFWALSLRPQKSEQQKWFDLCSFGCFSQDDPHSAKSANLTTLSMWGERNPQLHAEAPNSPMQSAPRAWTRRVLSTACPNPIVILDCKGIKLCQQCPCEKYDSFERHTWRDGIASL